MSIFNFECEVNSIFVQNYELFPLLIWDGISFWISVYMFDVSKKQLIDGMTHITYMKVKYLYSYLMWKSFF